MKPLTTKQLWKASYSHARLMLQGINGEMLFENQQLRNVIFTKPHNKLIKKSVLLIALQQVILMRCRDSIGELSLNERLIQFKMGF